VQAWRQCQQLYDYRYVQGLKPKADEAAPTLGRALHHYLEHYYNGLQMGEPPNDAHRAAWEDMQTAYDREATSMGNAAYAAGMTELADSLFGVVDRAVNIANRYYHTRGKADAGAWEILHVERWLEYPLDKGIDTPTRIDLITRDGMGRNWLWEHKSLNEFPPQTRRMKDLQTTLYAALAEQALGLKIDGVVWNYLRTKTPTVPETLKSGLLSMRKDLDTTWGTYLVEIERLGQDPTMYDQVRQRLEGREETAFFVRHDQPLYQSEGVLLRDFVATARTIKAVYESGVAFVPVRTIERHCDWCPMNKLCEAVVTGGDDVDLIERLYTRRNGKEEPVGSTSDPITDEGFWD